MWLLSIKMQSETSVEAVMLLPIIRAVQRLFLKSIYNEQKDLNYTYVTNTVYVSVSS